MALGNAKRFEALLEPSAGSSIGNARVAIRLPPRFGCVRLAPFSPRTGFMQRSGEAQGSPRITKPIAQAGARRSEAASKVARFEEPSTGLFAGPTLRLALHPPQGGRRARP